MTKAVIYIHGKGGNAAEAEHYKPLFPDCDVLGFDYKSAAPWEAKTEFGEYFDAVCDKYDIVTVVANSIGAYFALASLADARIEKAYFISPVTDMERLITDMMAWSGVTEDELKEKGEIDTDFGETLSYRYLCYVRENPIVWRIPTHILYGENDSLIPYEAVSSFAREIGAAFDVMPDGEHWFHTDAEMAYLDGWIKRMRNE